MALCWVTGSHSRVLDAVAAAAAAVDIRSSPEPSNASTASVPALFPGLPGMVCLLLLLALPSTDNRRGGTGIAWDAVYTAAESSKLAIPHIPLAPTRRPKAPTMVEPRSCPSIAQNPSNGYSFEAWRPSPSTSGVDEYLCACACMCVCESVCARACVHTCVRDKRGG
jgi:hypothetical protein